MAVGLWFMPPVPAQTNEVGFYLHPAAIPGPYRLSIEAPGMEKYEVTFVVQVAQSVVIDPVLKAGGVASIRTT